MQLRAALVVLAMGSLVVSCRPASTATKRPSEPTPAPTKAVGAPSLQALADRIDPGPVPGLLDGMPKWAITQYGLDRATADAKGLMNMLGQWRKLPESMTMQQRLGHAVELGFATIVLESGDPEAVTDPAAMAALAEIYGTFDFPAMFDPKGLLGSMIGLVAQGLAQHPDGATPDDARTAELLRWLTAALGRLPQLHRRMAARMMRDPASHPELANVLDRVAHASSGRDPALALALRRHSVEMRGSLATAVHHRELAAACFVELDLACGDAALATATQLADPTDAALAKQIAQTQQQRTKAQRIVALERATAIDEQLERAAMLAELGRSRGAREAFAAIRKQHPRDARALAGEIDAQLRDSLDFATAFATLDAAGTDLDHRERKYLELSIGVRSMQLMYVVLPKVGAGGVDAALTAALPALVPVRRDVTELAALGVDKAVVIEFLLGLGDELMPSARAGDNAAMMKVARELLPRATALRGKIPASRYAFDLTLAAAQFAPDGRAALAAAAQPPPVEDGPLAMRAAMTRLALAVTFDEPAEITAVHTQIDAWPESFGAAAKTRALARIDAVLWRTKGDASSRDRAIARYETVLAQSTQASDVDDLCNLAVLLVDVGRKDDAQLVLARALALDGSADLAKLHKAVLATPVDVAVLETLATSGEGQVGLAALAWLVAVDARGKSKWVAKRKAKQREPALRPRELPNAKGLGVGSALQVGVGYSTTNGLELNIDAGPTPRLFVLPPKSR